METGPLDVGLNLEPSGSSQGGMNMQSGGGTFRAILNELATTVRVSDGRTFIDGH